MAKINVDFSDKLRIRKYVLNKASPTVCLSCVPKQFGAEEEMVHIFSAVLHD